jgi:hypothetical protein
MAVACGHGRPIASPAGSSSFQALASRKMPARSHPSCARRAGSPDTGGGIAGGEALT